MMNIDQLHPENTTQQIRQHTTHLRQKGLAQFEIDFLTRDGDLLPAEVSVTMFELNGEQVLQGIVRDIRERRRQEQALRHARDEALEASRDEVAAAGQRQPRFAHAAQRHPGLQRNVASGCLRHAFGPTAGGHVANHRQHWPLPWGEYDVEISARVADRAWSAPARLHVVHPRPWYWRTSTLIGVAIAVGVLTLLIERGVRSYLRWRNRRYLAAFGRSTEALERDNRALTELARTDALTGLVNRRGFLVELADAWADAAARPLSVLVIDVDDFKRLNDTLGHHMGDETLVHLVKSLRAVLRPSRHPLPFRR